MHRTLLSVIGVLVSVSVYAIDFNVILDSAQEVPSPILGSATPSGTATVNVNTITGAVSISSGTYTGLTSAAAAAHLHGLAPTGSTAGVLIGLSVTGGTSGTISGSGSLGTTDLDGLLAGNTYLNLHTANNGPGEIRGQVVDPDIIVRSFPLTVAEEVPPPTVGVIPPTGIARTVVDISTGEIEIVGSYSGLTSAITGVHLHGAAPPGATAGVIFGLTPTGGTSGTFSGTAILNPTNLQDFLDGNTYINVHSTTNAAGEIRGQAVPEPSAALYGLLSLVGVAYVRRRSITSTA